MSRQETLIPQKKRGPKPTGKGVPIMTRLQPDILQSIDKWRESKWPVPSRPEAVRQLASIGLNTHPTIIDLLVYLQSLPPCPETTILINKVRNLIGKSGDS